MLHNPAANDGQPIELRQAINDARGEISELLGKAINRGALDEELSAHDKERMFAFLQHYGDLSPDLRYEGSTRSGYKTLPGPAEEAGVRRDPVPLGVLLDADMWTAMLFEENFAPPLAPFYVPKLPPFPWTAGKRLTGNANRREAIGLPLSHSPSPFALQAAP